MPYRFAYRILFVAALVGCSGNPPSGKIVFHSNRDGNFEIYSMKDDGTNLARLTNSSSYDVSPSWSPDGSRILFASDRDGNWDIYVMNADGSDSKRLTGPPGSNTAPSWAADGERILFVSTRDTMNGEIYLMNADGSGVERMTNDKSVKDSPIMSPDGALVMYVAHNGVRSTLVTMKVTDRIVSTPAFADGNCYSPAFSPDGTSIIFSSDRDGVMAAYEMQSPGGEVKKLTIGSEEIRFPSYCWSSEDILYSRNGIVCIFSIGSQREKILSTKGDFSPRWISN